MDYYIDIYIKNSFYKSIKVSKFDYNRIVKGTLKKIVPKPDPDFFDFVTIKKEGNKIYLDSYFDLETLIKNVLKTPYKNL